ncbi:signal peptidase I [Frigoribacterium sp. CFBP 13729]|uniref:signal peptidase I n=1 Tax=Frigoribacterium sp. CFBP 13729 TaxID=2775293 RepID=UPI00177FAE54|nr:signal peptidase I [Frigoribacterium sp. CFBP 13729]
MPPRTRQAAAASRPQRSCRDSQVSQHRSTKAQAVRFVHAPKNGEAVVLRQTASTPPRERGARPNGVLRFLRDVVVIFLAALLISFLIKTLLIRSFYIPSGSMETTLQIDDRVIVNELVPNLVDLHHGDVVVFEDPGGWLPDSVEVSPTAVERALEFVGLRPHDSNNHLIKRVIGLPGDTVACCNDFGQMTVNGVPLDEPYTNLTPEEPASRDPFEVTVPEGSLWVMGDNRNNSQDSRYNQGTPSRGFVPLSNVVGRASVISWPYTRWSWLDNYPSVFEGVEREKQ